MAWIRFFFWLYLLFLLCAEATVTSPADPDLWHRLALGEALWRTGHFPNGDAFSYLADYQTIADHEWGSALVFHALNQWGGGNAFVLAKLVTLGLTLAFVVQAGMVGRKPTAVLAAFYALVLLALLPSFQSTVRCMTFTHIFLALWLYWFQLERQGRAISTGWYVLTMILWANLHGGFAIGLAWLFLVTLLALGMARGLPILGGNENAAGPLPVDPTFRWKIPLGFNAFSPGKWSIRLGLCLLASLINPFGPQLWISTGRALLAPRQDFGEWAPVNWWPDLLASYPGYKLLLMVTLGVIMVQIIQRGWKQLDRPAMLLLGAFMLLSFTSARHTSIFTVVAGALAPGIFPAGPHFGRKSDPLHRLGYWALVTMLVIIPLYAALMVFPGPGIVLEYPSVSCPVAAVDYLKRKNIRGKLLVPFNYGSYALWELRGQMRVSMDGRYDLVYKPETYRRVEDFFFGRPDWQTLLSAPQPDAILLPQADAVYPKLRALPGWNEAWHDETDSVFLPKKAK